MASRFARFCTALLVAAGGGSILATGGCADDAPERAAEDLGSGSQEVKGPSNTGGVVKYGALITCATDLLYDPEPTSAKVIGLTYGSGGAGVAGPVSLEPGRPVLVQKSPGNVGGYYWVDPDFYGFRGTDAKTVSEFKDRFGFDQPSPLPPEVMRRGWVRESCIKASKQGEKLPSGPVDAPGADAEPWHHPKADDPGLYHIKHGCLIDPSLMYLNSKGELVSYAAYGVRLPEADAIYLGYNTPAAKKNGKLGGGGIIHAYVHGGQSFHVVYNQPKRDPNQATDSKGNVSQPARWSYGYASIANHNVWGWVWRACLDDKSTSAPPTASKIEMPDPDSDTPSGEADESTPMDEVIEQHDATPPIAGDGPPADMPPSEPPASAPPDDMPPSDPPPGDPPPSDPPPSGPPTILCQATCCEDGVTFSAQLADETTCKDTTHAACLDHGYVYTKTINGQLVYQRTEMDCWALCKNNTKGHLLEGIADGQCTNASKSYCADHGGLTDAKWSPCQPF